MPINKYLLIFLVTFGPAAYAKNTNTQAVRSVNQLVAYIHKLNPYVPMPLAKEIAESVQKYAKVYKLDPYVSLKIAMLESSFNPEAKSRTSDYGLYQVNLNTVLDYGFTQKDLTNIDGQTKVHMAILKHKIKVCGTNSKLKSADLPTWTCYHSYTEEFRQLYFLRGL